MTWIANILIITGLFLIGNKVKYAFYFTIVGEFIWTVYASINHQYDLAFICFIFTILNIRSLYKWSNNEFNYTISPKAN